MPAARPLLAAPLLALAATRSFATAQVPGLAKDAAESDVSTELETCSCSSAASSRACLEGEAVDAPKKIQAMHVKLHEVVVEPHASPLMLVRNRAGLLTMQSL